MSYRCRTYGRVTTVNQSNLWNIWRPTGESISWSKCGKFMRWSLRATAKVAAALRRRSTSKNSYLLATSPTSTPARNRIILKLGKDFRFYSPAPLTFLSTTLANDWASFATLHRKRDRLEWRRVCFWLRRVRDRQGGERRRRKSGRENYHWDLCLRESKYIASGWRKSHGKEFIKRWRRNWKRIFHSNPSLSSWRI